MTEVIRRSLVSTRLAPPEGPPAPPGTGPICGECEVRKASLVCDTCGNVAYCEPCCTTRHQKHAFRAHAITSVLESSRRDQVPKFCSDHSGERLTLFCEDDMRLICAECFLFGLHQNHSTRPLKEAYSEKQAELRNVMAPFLTKRGSVDKVWNEINTARNEIHANANAMQADVNKQVEKLVALLQEKKTETLKKITELEAERVGIVNEQLKKVERIKENFLTSLAAAETILGRSDPYEFLGTYALICKNLQPDFPETQVPTNTGIPLLFQWDNLREMVSRLYVEDSMSFFEMRPVGGVAESPKSAAATVPLGASLANGRTPSRLSTPRSKPPSSAPPTLNRSNHTHPHSGAETPVSTMSHTHRHLAHNTSSSALSGVASSCGCVQDDGCGIVGPHAHPHRNITSAFADSMPKAPHEGLVALLLERDGESKYSKGHVCDHLCRHHHDGVNASDVLRTPGFVVPKTPSDEYKRTSDRVANILERFKQMSDERSEKLATVKRMQTLYMEGRGNSDDCDDAEMELKRWNRRAAVQLEALQADLYRLDKNRAPKLSTWITRAREHVEAVQALHSKQRQNKDYAGSVPAAVIESCKANVERIGATLVTAAEEFMGSGRSVVILQ